MKKLLMFLILSLSAWAQTPAVKYDGAGGNMIEPVTLGVGTAAGKKIEVRNGGTMQVKSGGTFQIDSGANASIPANSLTGNISVNQFNGGTNANSGTVLKGDGTWGTPGGGVWGTITGNLSSQSDLANALAGKVPTTRLVAGKSLSSDVTLVASDISDSSSIGRTLITAPTPQAAVDALPVMKLSNVARFDLPSYPWVAAFEAKRLTPVSDGTSVATWNDFSGNGNNATQTAGSQPVYKIGANGIGGQPVVRFSGTQWLTTTTGGGSLTGGTFYYAAVVRFTTLTGAQTFLEFGENTTNKSRRLLKFTNSGGGGINNAISYYNSNTFVQGTVLSANTPYFVECVRDNATSIVTIYLNGVYVGSGTSAASSFTNTAITIGSNIVGSEWLQGDIALALFSNTIPNNDQWGNIRGYVASTYGLTIMSASQLDYSLTKVNLARDSIVPSAITDDGTNVYISNRGLDVTRTSPYSPVGVAHWIRGNGFADTLAVQGTGNYAEVYSTVLATDDVGDFKSNYGYGVHSTVVWDKRAYWEGYEGQSNSGLVPDMVVVQTRNSPTWKPYVRLRFIGSTNNVPGDIVFYKSVNWTGKTEPADSRALTIFTDGSGIQLGNTSATQGPKLLYGTGTPEGAATAVVGSLYLRTDGGTSTTLYVKESGTGNTGWVAK